MSEGLEDLVFGINNIQNTKLKINEVNQAQVSTAKPKANNDNTSMSKEAYIAEDLDNIKNINSRLFSNATCVSEPNLHITKPLKINQKLEKYYNELFKSESKGAFQSNNSLLVHKKLNSIFKDIKAPPKNNLNFKPIGESQIESKAKKVLSCSINPIHKIKKDSTNLDKSRISNYQKKQYEPSLLSFQEELNNINRQSKKRNFADQLTSTSTMKSNFMSGYACKEPPFKLGSENFLFTSVQKTKKQIPKLTWWEKGNTTSSTANIESRKTKNSSIADFAVGSSFTGKVGIIKDKAINNVSLSQTRAQQSKFLKLF